MSKQSEAKKNQNYRTTPDTCSNCTQYQSDIVEKRTQFGSWKEEKGKRCSVGGFAVKKTATCDNHERVDYQGGE